MIWRRRQYVNRLPGRSAARRRGAVYIIVLATAMIITVLGVSGLMAMRVQQRAAALELDMAQARLNALAGIDRVLLRMYLTPTWRTTLAPGVWFADVPYAGGTFSATVTDPEDGSLADDPYDAALIVATGVAGDARYKLAVRVGSPLSERAAGNLLTEQTFESGSVGAWYANSAGHTVANYDGLGRSGTRSLLVANRDDAWNGPAHQVGSNLESGKSYRTDIWINTLGSESHTYRARLKVVSSGSGTQYYDATPWTGTTKDTWTLMSGTVTPTWSGTLSSAELYIEADAHTHDFHIDDASFVRIGTSIVFVPGSWRRVTN